MSVGGGKVIDAGKYAAFLRNMPFISVPTSSSSDGFSSASASLLVHGKRTSVPAKLAHGIIVDTQVIRTAPEKFIYSGIGIWCQRLQHSMTGFLRKHMVQAWSMTLRDGC